MNPNQSFISSEQIFVLVGDLATQGYSVQKNFFPATWTQSARGEMHTLSEKFKRAGIGRLDGNQVRDEIRKDTTLWWEVDSPTGAQKPYIDFLKSLQSEINRTLFLGLWDFEGHYAIYEPGAFYKTHVDRFKNDSKRTVTLVTFFNESWKSTDGGLLVMETKDGARVEVQPDSGTLVVFLSDAIPHEVTTTRRKRLSFAGWYRTR